MSRKWELRSHSIVFLSVHISFVIVIFTPSLTYKAAVLFKTLIITRSIFIQDKKYAVTFLDLLSVVGPGQICWPVFGWLVLCVQTNIQNHLIEYEGVCVTMQAPCRLPGTHEAQ